MPEAVAKTSLHSGINCVMSAGFFFYFDRMRLLMFIVSCEIIVVYYDPFGDNDKIGVVRLKSHSNSEPYQLDRYRFVVLISIRRIMPK